MSRVLEGWTARLFRARLQPVQIAKRCIRAMEAHQTISLSKTFVPNSYAVSLAPSDLSQFEGYQKSLERDLAEALLGAARERNFTLLAYPTVELESDEDLAPGDVRVSCAMVDASGDEVAAGSKELGAVAAGHTMVLDRDAALERRPRAGHSWIEWHDGESLQRGEVRDDSITIGRDPRNDVVLEHLPVSRRHAEIRLRLGRYTLYDLQSRNGTTVNGRRVVEVALADGDVIGIGGSELVFHTDK